MKKFCIQKIFCLILEEKQLLKTRLSDDCVWILGTLIFSDRTTINENEWHGHMVWYIQYFRREAKWVGRSREITEGHDKDCIEQEFQLARTKLAIDI